MSGCSSELKEGRARRSALVDLLIVAGMFAVVALSIPWLNPVLRHGTGASRVVALAAYQFLIEGAAPLTLMKYRGQRFSDYGFIRARLLASVGLGVSLALLYDVALSVGAGHAVWLPLIRQPATQMTLTLGLPFAVLGVPLVVLDWGFLEGFFGIYFARQVDVLITRGGGWLSPGALAFACFNGGVHLLVGQGLVGFLTSFASGYAIAVVPALTGNAWGGVLVQVLTNAVGRLP